MNVLFNDGWNFAELALNSKEMYKDEKPVLFNPEDYLKEANNQTYNSVLLPHDWMISNVKDLYRSSVGFYKKEFELSDAQVKNKHNAISFEGVYMNSAVWVNGKLAGTCKYGYSTFEFDISELLKSGKNEILVIAVLSSLLANAEIISNFASFCSGCGNSFNFLRNHHTVSYIISHSH